VGKRRPILQTIAYELLGAAERHMPSLTRSLGYYSIIDKPSKCPGAEIFFREARWFDPNYVDSFRKLASPGEADGLDLTRPEHVQISVLHTDDFTIFGHIKAPIRLSNGHALSYSPLQRFTLTDAYPFPFSRTIRVSGGVIFIPNLENYFHLMMDHLLPAFSAVVRDPGRYKSITFVLQRDFPLIEFFAGLLNEFGISTDTVRVGKFDRICGGTLIIGSAEPRDTASVFMYREEIDKIAAVIDKRLPKFDTPKRFYVKRTGTPRRLLKNEAALIARLSERGIVPFEIGFDKPLEQIALFRNAELIVSVHGAALTNLIWCKNARVIEIFPGNSRPKHYIHISAQMGLDYEPIIGSIGDKRDSFEINLEDIEYIK